MWIQRRKHKQANIIKLICSTGLKRNHRNEPVEELCVVGCRLFFKLCAAVCLKTRYSWNHLPPHRGPILAPTCHGRIFIPLAKVSLSLLWVQREARVQHGFPITVRGSGDSKLGNSWGQHRHTSGLLRSWIKGLRHFKQTQPRNKERRKQSKIIRN